jgi:hypothetical protein
MKLTRRKGFNFFRSYYDVYNELSNKDKLTFIDALLDRQFLGHKPIELKGMAKFAYISQTNSIDSQVKGYEDKTKTRLDNRPYIKGLDTPPVGGADEGNEPPTLQEEEKGKEKGELTLPDLETFMIYVKDYLKDDEDRYSKCRQRMIDTYNAWKLNGWKDGNDKKIKNWKTKAIMQLRYI